MMQHKPVLLREVCEWFGRLGPGSYLDCTFGGGGHSQALLGMHEGVQLWALDEDPFVIPYAEQLATAFPGRFVFTQMNFSRLEDLGKRDFTGILFDLGVSSFQLDDGQRGFSFRTDAKTDMRFNPQIGDSAETFLESADEADLIQAIREFGEERHWKRVVRRILEARGRGILGSTAQLANLIASAVGRSGKIHPATRSFQGIRIAVNQELHVLEKGLEQAFKCLQVGGVVGVISFHSLEDRIVKHFFKRLIDKVVIDGQEVKGQILTKKPIVAQDDEMKENPRARSAKLRFLRKVGI